MHVSEDVQITEPTLVKLQNPLLIPLQFVLSDLLPSAAAAVRLHMYGEEHLKHLTS